MSRKIFSLIFTLLVSLLIGTQSLPIAADSTQLIMDFESGEPTGWFAFSGGGAGVATSFPTVPDTDPLARPDQVGDNTFVEATFDASVGFAGFGQDFSMSGGPQDWSNFTAVSFWLYGNNSGQSLQFEIMDNRSDPNSDTAERFDTIFVDDFSGWQKITIPFADFTRATDFQPGGAPDDGLTLTEMWGLAVILDGSAGTLQLDDVGLDLTVIDDFESGLPSGVDGDGNAIGFFKFEGPDAIVSFTDTDILPSPVPDSAAGNMVLQVDSNVPAGSWGGVVHAFENETLDTWTPQDWSQFVGISFWLYGNNTGSVLFIDVQDNRAPGTTGDTAERYSIDIIDDFSGWQFIEIPFDSMTRKEIGNGAPIDGFNLTEVHGWAFGIFSAGQTFTNYIDDVALYGNADVPELAVGFTANNFDIDEGTTGQITVALNRPLGEDDPAQVSVDYTVETVVAEPGRDFVQPPAGILTFVQGGPSELSFPLETLDDNKFEGTERVILRLSNPVDVAPGFIMQAAASIVDDENYDPLLIDDFELGAYLWDSADDVTLSALEMDDSDPLALPGQGAYENALEATLPVPADINVQGRICNQGNGMITIVLYATDEFDVRDVDHTTVTLGDAYETHTNNQTGEPKRHEEDVDDDGDLDLVFHFRFNETGLSCDPDVVPFNGRTFDGQPFTARGTEVQFGRDFALGEDWSLTDGLTFYYYGQGTGDTVTLELLDNRAPDPGPSGWSMVWSDEFNDPAGTPPNSANWGYEIGDGTVNGIPGWGNDELQYYTDSTDNAATDGNGNLVISAQEADGSLTCFYGPCEYTSARLISWHKAEFAYGRIESRIQVPDGEAGLWPAFWSLGTDIDLVGWPQTGEIDIMEYVSRLPEEVFGTIHGPGYFGGTAYGNTHPFPGGVSGSYHTFTIEWQPNLIEWYVDGILYHTATPGDVAPNEWVFNDPVFLLFNLAIGGNFGGAVSEDLTMPQEMVIDYVRVYQGPDTAERFEATFTDDFVGWQEVSVPFTAFTRSADQPAGAPDDGLTLTDVWGYGFKLSANGLVESVLVDQVRLLAPVEVTVINTNDDGPGSLREAINLVTTDGLVFFDPSLANSTISLSSGALAVNKGLTIDGSGAPGLTISGNNASRVFEIGGGVAVSINDLTIANGQGETGAGIHVGENSSLTLLDSTVEGSSANGDGGGLLAALGTTIHIERSTFSGNSGGVGGALRTFGDATVLNSTLSGNIATGWWGGAIFHTDGVMDIINSTITSNVGPDWAPSAIFVGSWSPDQLSTINLTNSIVANNQWIGCYVHAEFGGVPTLSSGGHNIASDATCNLTAAGDQPDTDPMLGLLADNGGPTLTHALLAGSVAIGGADTAVCPTTDQRGVARDAACDSGAFEFVP